MWTTKRFSMGEQLWIVLAISLVVAGCQTTAPAESTPQRPAWTGPFRALLVDEQYPCKRGMRCFFMVHLLNLETDREQKWLRFNFNAESIGKVDAFLDNPIQTTFLIDSQGRQYPLAFATGIDDRRPLTIPAGGSSRFALFFALPPSMQEFRYEATLYYRTERQAGGQVERVRISSGDQQIRIADFRP